MQYRMDLRRRRGTLTWQLAANGHEVIGYHQRRSTVRARARKSGNFTRGQTVAF